MEKETWLLQDGGKSMLKNVKKKAMLATLVVLAMGNTLSVAAATAKRDGHGYIGYVKKTEDHVTETIYKTAYGDATNDVLTVENDANLCSWINNYMANQTSEKATYSGPGKYYMKYTHVPDLEHPGLNLATTMVISTQWFELSSSISSGYWSPDTF